MLLGASATATMAALLLPALAAFAPAAASSTTPAAAVKMREQMSARAFNSLACAANLEATLAGEESSKNKNKARSRVRDAAGSRVGLAVGRGGCRSAACLALRKQPNGPSMNNQLAAGAIADAREIAARGGGGGGGLLETLLLLAAPPSAAVLAAQLSETFGAGTLGGRGFSAGGTVGGRTVGGGLGGNLASLGPAQAQSAFARYGVAHGREVICI
ncbi:hypothetical protein T492DRAFT_839221 [Pavlovales sp. CCMP2436]|nr:hypothetical protein T492DRAFT_839221 [Pavlovales sp. CCMP2436]